EGGSSSNVTVTLTLTADGVSGTGTLAVPVTANLPGRSEERRVGEECSAGGVRTDTAEIVVSAVNEQLVEQTLESFAGQVLSGLSTATQAPAASGSQQIDVSKRDGHVASVAAGTLPITEGGSSSNVTVTLTLTADGVSGTGTLAVPVTANLPG